MEGLIQATVAVYPLLQKDYDAVNRAVQALEKAPVEMTVGTTSSQIVGRQPDVFQALEAAFEAAGELGATVMTVTVTNACPLP